MGKSWLGCVVLCLLCASGVGRAENVSRTRARKTFEHEGRVLPVKYERKVRAWAKKDQRMQGWADAYKTKSKYYKIETNVPRFIVELEIKPFLDELYTTYKTVFRKRFGLSGSAANGKLIRIFSGYEAYAKHAKPGSIIPRSNPGFIRNGDELVVYYEETCPEVFYGTMFHEGAHQFVKNLMPGASVPLWLDEALAVTFEGCVYSRVTGKITCGSLPPDRLMDAQAALKDATAPTGVSLAEHLFMRYPKTHFRAREYALAWSFVHYVTNTEQGKYRKKFARFVKGLNGAGKKDIDVLLRQKLGVPFAKLDQGWRAFVLAQPKPVVPNWIVLDVDGQATGVDLTTNDRIVSIDGRGVASFEEFKRRWTERDKTAPSNWVVVRVTPGQGAMGESQRLVKTTVPAHCPMVIEGRRSQRRGHNLAD